MAVTYVELSLDHRVNVGKVPVTLDVCRGGAQEVVRTLRDTEEERAVL
jgi:hypothetical protein